MRPFIKFRPLKPLGVNYPLNLVSLDRAHVVMPLGNKKYIMVAIDHFTRLIEVTILTYGTSQSIIILLNKKKNETPVSEEDTV